MFIPVDKLIDISEGCDIDSNSEGANITVYSTGVTVDVGLTASNFSLKYEDGKCSVHLRRTFRGTAGLRDFAQILLKEADKIDKWNAERSYGKVIKK